MRCPDCNKFVGMENGEPEINNIEASHLTGLQFSVNADVRGVRQCANCGTDLKDLSMDVEGTCDIGESEEWKKLTPEEQATLKAAIKKGDVEVEVEDDGGDVDEGGGGRYAKNIITTTVNYTLTVTYNDLKVSASGSLESKNAASEFEECC